MYDIPCSTGEYPRASSRTPLHGQLTTDINFLHCGTNWINCGNKGNVLIKFAQSEDPNQGHPHGTSPKSSDISNLNIQAGFQCCGAGSGAAPFFVWSRSRFDGEAPARFLAPTVECRYSDNN